MAPKKKQSIEERRKAKREAERKRRAKIKADPVKYQEALLKEQQRRKERKEQKKILTVHELTPRAQREKRKKWREYQKKCRGNKKERELILDRLLRENTPSSCSELDNFDNQNRSEASSPSILRNITSPCIASPLITPSSPISSNASVSSNNTKMSRQRLQGQKNSRLRRDIARRLIEKQKKTIDTMKTRIHSLQVKYSRLARRIPSSGITKRFSRTRVSNPVSKKRLAVRLFLEDDLNSKLCPGKNDTKTQSKVKKQKRILLDSLERLHQKYNDQAIASLRVSYATFCRMRPFWVVHAKLTERDTCLCALHENSKLLIDKCKSLMMIEESSISQLCSSVVCDTKSYECMARKCSKCDFKSPHFNLFESEQITYKQWIVKSETRTIRGKEKLLKRTVKDELLCTKRELVDKLLEMLPKILQHSFNIGQQYEFLTKLKENLACREVIIHVDFSENYSCKYFSEAQSVHFGASRQQISLHTGVLYFRSDNSTIESISFCTISDCLRHDASAIFAHLQKAMNYLLKDQVIEKIHVVSDGPSSQYKNKYNFYLFTQHLVNIFNINEATWNFSESGHGKGAPDGVGAAIKRTADSHVTHGNDIPDFDTFFQVLQAHSNVILYKVTEDEINNAYDLLKKSKYGIKSIPKTKKAHQLTWTRQESNIIQLRELSCTNCPNNILCTHFPSSKHEIGQEIAETHTDHDSVSQSVEPSLLREGVWVLTKFSGKKNQIFTYVGQIVSVDVDDSDEPYLVQFTRKKSSNNLNETTFIWKDNDTSAVSLNDVLTILPEPTPGRRDELIFNFNFSKYEYIII